tara:strand:+ start:202 stop:984 length:783 start_codon:yes stop_codon:yes gene_type:complete
MSAFSESWSLIKEWTPNWRDIAEDLPWLSESKQKRLMSEESLDDIMGQGNSFTTFPHPNNEKFVVKIPFNRPGFPQNLSDRTGIPDNIPQIMEEMGFPISSELDVQGEYLVQPRLNQHAVDTGTGKKGRYRKGIADILLNHAFSDRVGHNYGRDQTGNWRMFDADMEQTDPYDWWPNSPDIPKEWLKNSNYKPRTVGEILQEDLDKWKIQLPASRMLNVLDNHDGVMESFKGLLEAIEPYSDNPNTVQIEGKSPWLEGYE